MTPDALLALLQHALGVSVTCGQITLNINEGRLQSVETHTKMRILPVTATTTHRAIVARVDNSTVSADIIVT